MRMLTVSEVEEISAGRGRAAVILWAAIVSGAMDAADKARDFWEGAKQGYKDGDAGD